MRVPERSAALPRWQRESRAEEPQPPVESPWDEYDQGPDGARAGGTPPAHHESEAVEVAAATAPVEVAEVTLEPPEPESAPVSAPNDAGTPAPAERNAQAQQETPGPRVAQ